MSRREATDRLRRADSTAVSGRFASDSRFETVNSFGIDCFSGLANPMAEPSRPLPVRLANNPGYASGRAYPGSADAPGALASPAGERPFIDGNVICGRVVGIHSSSSFPGGVGKLASWAAGGRWQHGQRQWQESAIFVEPLGAEGSGVERCLHVSGDMAGAVREGNVIEARVTERAGRLEARRITNLSTNADATPAGFGAGAFAVLLVALAALVALLWWAASTGALAAGIAAVVSGALLVALDVAGTVLAAVAPALIPFALLFFIVRLIFRGR